MPLVTVMYAFHPENQTGNKFGATYWCERPGCQRHASDFFAIFQEEDPESRLSTFLATHSNNPQLASKRCFRCDGRILKPYTLREIVTPVIDLEYAKSWLSHKNHPDAEDVVEWLIRRVEELEAQVKQ